MRTDGRRDPWCPTDERTVSVARLTSVHDGGAQGRVGPLGWLVGVALVGGGAIADVHPSGVEVADRIVTTAAVAVSVAAGAWSRPWALFAPAAVSASFARDALGFAFGGASVVLATANGWRSERTPALGAAAAGCAAIGLLRLRDLGPTGVSAAVALVAVAPVLVSAARQVRPRARRGVVAVVGVVGAVVVAACVGAAMAAAEANDRLRAGREELEAGIRATRRGETASAHAAFRRAAQAFADADGALDRWWALPGRAVPIVGHNLRAGTATASTALELATAASDVVAAASEDALRPRQGRIPIEEIAKFRDPIGQLMGVVESAEAFVAGARSPWLLPPTADALDVLGDRLAEARPDLDVAMRATEALPVLLGAGGVQRYLVLFVTPVEGRAAGFPGNFAEIEATDGQLEMTRFGRISELNGALTGEPALDMPEEYLRHYEVFDIRRDARFLTLSPHFPSVAEHARQLYGHATGQHVDGVISVDPTAIASLLRLTGPVALPGRDRPLNHRNAAAFLLEQQYVDFPERADRVDALETLGRETFQRLTSIDLPPPAEIGRVLGPIASAGHLRVVSFTAVGGAFLERIDITGALDPVVGDALAITTNNAIGAKMDLFLQRTVRYEVSWDPATGSVDAVAVVTLRNDAPTSGLPPSVIGNNAPDPEGAALPTGTNRTYLSLFTPLDLEQATLAGRPVTVDVQREQGRNVYSTLVVVPPAGGTVTAEFRLNGSVDAASYVIDLWTQLLPRPDEVHLVVETPSGVDSLDLVLDEPRRVVVGAPG